MKEVWWLVPKKNIEVGSQNQGLIDNFIEHEVSLPELLQGKEVMIYIDDQVRDLGEQAKKNAESVPHHYANSNAEKTPTINIMSRRLKPRLWCLMNNN
ncbi:hypothetical protein Ahy_A09g045102 isoform B [Arachis hypogaea]|uniref:Uncharacterized protein n=1 Tax=Arachis hypogaea TaxID=3818 RepID=A0A445BLJ4_ARAHY|nr:hypothetical protein Ahy_A09g045102 isoform B [Arachis hypogaea]